jgi:hypothetical protein
MQQEGAVVGPYRYGILLPDLAWSGVLANNRVVLNQL